MAGVARFHVRQVMAWKQAKNDLFGLFFDLLFNQEVILKLSVGFRVKVFHRILDHDIVWPS
jgi:hypothetical protein